jgi:hypothetical protein
MTPLICDLVKNSRWMDDEELLWLDVHRNTPICEVFERVWINVSASFRLNWREVCRSTVAEPTSFSCRIISIILITNLLSKKLDIKSKDINVLLGSGDAKLRDDFFEYLQYRNS